VPTSSDTTKLLAEDTLRRRQTDDPKDAKAATLVFAAAFAGISLWLFALLPSETMWVERAKTFEQPRFWPGIALGIMSLFSIGFLVQSTRSRPSGSAVPELTTWILALEYLVWFLAYVWLVPRLGYLPTTVLFTCTLAWRMGYRDNRWLALASLFGISVVVLFKSIMGVNIPAGALYETLPPGSLRSFVMTNF